MAISGPNGHHIPGLCPPSPIQQTHSPDSVTPPPEQHSGGRVVVLTSAAPSPPLPQSPPQRPSPSTLASLPVGLALARTTDEMADGAGETDGGAEKAGANRGMGGIRLIYG
ncbi:hypothetical protein V491_06678, partial [Pseudogymnoascus sp. VKM F-3775]